MIQSNDSTWRATITKKKKNPHKFNTFHSLSLSFVHSFNNHFSFTYCAFTWLLLQRFILLKIIKKKILLDFSFHFFLFSFVCNHKINIRTWLAEHKSQVLNQKQKKYDFWYIQAKKKVIIFISKEKSWFAKIKLWFEFN